MQNRTLRASRLPLKSNFVELFSAVIPLEGAHLISDSNDTEPEEFEDELYHHGGKLCPKCKAWNIVEAGVCAHCSARPLLWRSDYKLMLWLILGISIAGIVSRLMR